MTPLPITRQTWVLLHRWAGLTIALFLIVVGFTGALLPWQRELTMLARPSLSAATAPYPGARPLAPLTLVDRVERATGGHIGFVDLETPRDHVAIFSIAAKTAKPLPYDMVWANPYTGAIRLRYRDGVLADGPQTIMSFLFRLHTELALGRVGMLALGVAALVWTVDCFVGFYLTLPVRRRREGPPPRAQGWWQRWQPAWLVRWTAGRYKLTFDLHRAGGLWLWPLLLVFAWSSVGLNLREVHAPVMRLFGAVDDVELPMPPRPVTVPPLRLGAAQRRGEALLRGIGAREGFVVERPAWIYYDAGRAAYRYSARSSLDVVSDSGRTIVSFSGIDGRLLRFEPPVPAGGADAFSQWLNMLHFAQVFGLPYRALVSLVGALIVALSVTGVLIWMKKRTARLLSRHRAPRVRAFRAPRLAAAE